MSPDQSAPARKTPQTRSSDPTLKLRRRGESEAMALESRAGVWSHRFGRATAVGKSVLLNPKTLNPEGGLVLPGWSGCSQEGHMEHLWISFASMTAVLLTAVLLREYRKEESKVTPISTS